MPGRPRCEWGVYIFCHQSATYISIYHLSIIYFSVNEPIIYQSITYVALSLSSISHLSITYLPFTYHLYLSSYIYLFSLISTYPSMYHLSLLSLLSHLHIITNIYQSILLSSVLILVFICAPIYVSFISLSIPPTIICLLSHHGLENGLLYPPEPADTDVSH